MLTTRTDKILQTFTFVTKEGLNFNKIITPGQKEIMEIILSRGIEGMNEVWYNRVHVMAHTRFGKSMAIGAAVAVRASMKGEPWAIVAPTKDQAQIIMDYLIFFSVNDPIISALLKVNAKQITNERLTQRKSRAHITYLKGGEVRTFSADQTMGFGSPNLILDEAGLITNEQESKSFRMLGDSTDNFLMKVGNPWDSIDQTTGEEHHFFQSYKDPSYYQIDIQIERGIAEGRVTEEYHNEVKKKPNYFILYKNTFPDTERRDKDGYIPLLGHTALKRALVEPGTIESAGAEIMGCDPADGGQNESVIAKRSMNLARIVLKTTDVDCLQFADKIATYGSDIDEWFIDKNGVGSGTVRKLQAQAKYFRKLNPINAGDNKPLKELPKEEQGDQFLNLRAYIYWKLKLWVEQGGKIEKVEGLEKQLLALKYKNNKQGKVIIISKDELHKRQIHDLGLADAISFTFAPRVKKIVVQNQQVSGGVQPYYPNIGF